MFKLSENVNLNYVATICKITELFPIENSDNLLRTVVNGFDIEIILFVNLFHFLDNIFHSFNGSFGS